MGRLSSSSSASNVAVPSSLPRASTNSSSSSSSSPLLENTAFPRSSVSTRDVDLEYVFFRVHARLCKRALSLFPSWLRWTFLLNCIVNAAFAVSLLAYMHGQFVPPSSSGVECLASELRRHLSERGFDSDARGSSSLPPVFRVTVEAIAARIDDATIKVMRDAMPGIGVSDPTYVLSERGALASMTPKDLEALGIPSVTITIQSENACFGDYPFLLETAVGYDTCMVNAMHSLTSSGSVYLVHANRLHQLHSPPTPIIGAIFGSLCLYVVSTFSVAVMLRETQRALIFLSWDWREQQGFTLQTIVDHALKSLVIVPSTLGLFFFIRLFDGDNILSFMMQALVWLCEMFLAVVARTDASAKWFPRVWFLCFFAFHMYHFMYPRGYAYIAFTSMVLVLQCTMYALWLVHEAPAFQSGLVTVAHPRSSKLPETRKVLYTRKQKNYDARALRRTRLGRKSTQSPAAIADPSADILFQDNAEVVMINTSRRTSSARQRLLPRSPLVTQF